MKTTKISQLRRLSASQAAKPQAAIEGTDRNLDKLGACPTPRRAGGNPGTASRPPTGR
ncbi:hypothetical protein SBA2_800001 [Acidobacteriia bacterium SbA2]|nr:hypothetical protein SBA2_800001 [Acidobacteriia bacterium SbA2]